MPDALCSVPTASATTSAVTVQVWPDNNNPLKTEIVSLPEAAVRVAPVQSVAALAGSAITMPGGRTSVNPMALAKPAFALLSMSNVSVARVPSGPDEGEKLFEKPGRASLTVKSALAGPLFPASDVRSPLTFM